MTLTLARLRASAPARAAAILASAQLALGGLARPALALTSGPAAPEYASFTPADTASLVQPYTGDLSYNLPLMTVPGPNGGFPINLGYSSELSMEDEASWVGFGWNLNVGAVTRQLNQYADDWDGDTADCMGGAGDRVEQVQSLEKSWTLGLSGAKTYEIAGAPGGIDKVNGKAELYYNNQRGPGRRMTVSFPDLGFQFAGLGLSWDSQGGVSVEPDFHLSTLYGALSAGIGFDINGRQGLQSMSFQTGVSLPGTTVGGGNGLGVPVTNVVQGVGIPTEGQSYGATLQLGTQKSLVISDFKGSVSAHYEQTTVQGDGSTCTPVYGFLHLEGAGLTDLRDFAQGPVRWSTKLPALSPARVTQDAYTVTGPGVVGAFRPFRAEFAAVSGPRRVSEDKSDALTADVATGDSTHVGVGYRWGGGEVSSGPWQAGDQLSGPLRYQAVDEDEPVVEPWWFRMVDESTAADPSADPLRSWGGLEALRPQLVPQGDTWATGTVFEDSDAESLELDAKVDTLNRRVSRDRRGTTVQALTFDELCALGLGRGAGFTDAETGDEVGVCAEPLAHPHHIGAFVMHAADGSRYVYALAAYNRAQIDRSWRIDPDDEDPVHAQEGSAAWNLTRVNPKSWEPATDGELDGYLQQTSLPPYAYAWLLTEVLPADYVDRSEDGVSDDDAGSWVHIDYTRVAADYRWRTPYTGAALMTGSPYRQDDDLASYSYGEREVYAVARITTPTHVAVFDTSARKDGLEAPGEQASEDLEVLGKKVQVSSLRAQVKLDAIRLYARAQQEQGEPLQTVHLGYQDAAHKGYELGRNVPNHALYKPGNVSATHRGKLTLRRVWHSWQGSAHGALSPYVFDYGDEEQGEDDFDLDNPPYDPRRLDRWGQVRCLGSEDEQENYPHALSPSTWPGEARDGCEDEAETAARAWRLKRVIQPTGGALHIAYEPDDYALVEREPAMATLDVVGLGSVSASSSRENTAKKASIATADTAGAGLRVYFRLTEKVDPTSLDAEAYVEDRYLRGMEQVQYRAFARLTGTSETPDERWDFVQGYAPVQDCAGCEGVAPGGEVGWFTLKAEAVGPDTILPPVHPMRLAAIRHLQFSRADLLGFTLDPIESAADLKDAALEAVGKFDDLLELLTGFVPVSLLEGRGEKIRLDGWTTVRLYAPEARRGGGARVRRVCMQERPSAPGAPDCTEAGALGSLMATGQDYRYELEDGRSSGVAYEPAVGREESSLVQPIPYRDGGFLRAAQALFLETPLLGEFYPGPSVGYRRVVVQSLARAEAASTGMSLRDAAPVTVHELYSPATFPVRVDDTGITADRDLYGFHVDLTTLSFTRQAARSQGYTVVLNDMAGKPWRTSTLIPAVPGVSAEKLLSRTEYVYRTEAPFDPDGANRLSSEALVRGGDGQLGQAMVGQVYDMFTALHEDAQRRSTNTVDGNAGFPNGSFIPAYLLILPSTANLDLSVKTAVTTKVVRQSGLLAEIRTFNGQGTATATHVAYDPESGQPVVVRTHNEWEDYLCASTELAWWRYPRMGGAWRNLGLRLEAQGPSAGQLGAFSFAQELSGLLVPGDLVRVGEEALYWVVGVSGKKALLIDAQGAWAVAPGKQTVTVLRSGYRNATARKAGAETRWTADAGGCTRDPLVEIRIQPTDPTKGDDRVYYVPKSVADQMTPVDPNSSTPQYVFDHEPGYTFPVYTPYDPALGLDYVYLQPGFYEQPTMASVDLDGDGVPEQFPVYVATPDFDPSEFEPRVLDASAVEYAEDWSVPCALDDGAVCAAEGALYNPYLAGTAGLWRPLRSWAPRAARTGDDPADAGDAPRDIRVDGILDPYTPFVHGAADPAATNADWIRTSTVTTWLPMGHEVETQDALGLHASALYGHGDAVPTAVAQNARRQDVLFDGFEDESSQGACGRARWPILDALDLVGAISGREAHTGAHSLSVDMGEPVTVEIALDPDGTAPSDEPRWTASAKGVQPRDACLPAFAPSAPSGETRDYVVSAWVKRGGALPADVVVKGYRYEQDAALRVSVGGETTDLKPSGPVIDGWQRVEGVVAVPGAAGSLTLSLRNTSTTGAEIYFDDLRVLPYAASLRAFVYDAERLRLDAELDANHYATFYRYDEEGQLIGKDRETEDGVQSVSEGRTRARGVGD